MPRHIYLFSSVNPSSCEMLVRQLMTYDKESNEEITIFINSPGGSVMDFFAIYNVMELCKSPIKTVVMGMAASAAAILAACGKTRMMTEDSQFMLHEVWSFLMGSVSDMGESVERMKAMQDRLLGILVKHTGKTYQEIRTTMGQKDKYFTAAESMNFGLVDSIIRPDSAQVVKLSERLYTEGREVHVVDGKPEIELLCEGTFSHPEYGELNITEQILSRMKENFDTKVRGIEVSIDYTHDNDNGEKPAAFWIKSLEVVSNGKGTKVLKAKGEFTPAGQKKVSEKEYKYASADFVMNYRDGTGKHFPYVLQGGTLTNRPFIKELNAIKLSEHQPKQKETIPMEKDALILALKDKGVDVVALMATAASFDSMKSEVEGYKTKIATLSALPAQKEEEIKNLKDQLKVINDSVIVSDKEAAFNALMSQGKVVPAQKDVILASFDTAAKMEAFYKDALPVIKTSSSGKAGDGLDDTLSTAEAAVVNSGVLTKEQVIAGRTIEK